MLCEKCKIREANIQYIENVNGVQSEHYYCLNCAREIDFNGSRFEGEFPLAKLLSGLLRQNSGEQHPEECAQITCPRCGTSLEEFITNSRFGCPDCYEVFDLLIGENIKSLQGSETHKGKHPKYPSGRVPTELSRELTEEAEEEPESGGTQDELLRLRRLLKEAVAAEEFEDAARYRDEIRRLEQGGE